MTTLAQASCTTTGYVVSDASFEQTTQIIKENLGNKGYYQTGKTTSIEFDGTINTTNYGSTSIKERADITGQKLPYDNSVAISGNGSTKVNTSSSETTTMGKYYIDRYCFENENGESVEYQASYYKSTVKDKLSKQNVVVYNKVSLVGCTTSNKKKWDDVCGDGGIVARNIKQPQKQLIEVDDDASTISVAYVALIVIPSIIGLVILATL